MLKSHLINPWHDRMLCIAGFDGYFKQLDPSWEEALGFSEAELKAKPFIDFVHPEDRAATQAEADKIAAGMASTSFENRYRCKDGSYKWLKWSLTTVVEPPAIYAVARDITDQKQRQETTQRELVTV